MKYVKSYESFKENRKSDNNESDKLNEEFLGLDKLIGFFKGLFKKAGEKFNSFKGSLEELKGKVGELMSPKDPNSIAIKAIEDFKKKPSANDEDCFTLVRQIMDPDDGALSDNNIAELFKTIKDEETRKNVQYTFEFARKETIKKIKYGGGKVDNWVIGKPLPKPAIANDLKTGKMVDRTPDGKDFIDKNHLPDLKNAIKGLDDTKKKDATLKFLDNMANIFDTFCEAAQLEGSEEKSAEYKVGDTVVYKREKFNEEEWKKITDEDKKKTDEGKIKELIDKEEIGIKKISKIDGDKISFEGADFTKTKEDILMKAEGVKVEGQDDLVNTLKDVKTKNPEAIGDINAIADIYKDKEANKEIIADIQKAAKISK
jgi:hypothetical protein